ncbi:MAG TPA: ester cyclase [Burkholderiales bacterium]|nr:ester cyclase [Burkholderiales bacterium]
MFTRRGFLKGALGAGAGLAMGSAQTAGAQIPAAQLERNKAVAVRFKKAQGTKEEDAVMKEVLAPNYKRLRGGMQHLAANAQDQGFPGAGSFLRGAFPDRVDVIEEVIAEGDQVGVLFRLTGTHQANLFGIPPTGKKVDVHEIAVMRIVDGKMVEAWFMADEAGLLKQLGASFPPRKDGKTIVPPVTNSGEDPDAVLARLQSGALSTQEDRNRLMVAQSKGSAPPGDLRAPDYKQKRFGFQHLRDYGLAKGTSESNISRAFPNRRDRIDGFIAEGEKVWMRFKLAGAHTASLYGMPPTGKVIEAPEIGIMRIVDGKWRESWYFGDELGLMLQLGISPNVLLG